MELTVEYFILFIRNRERKVGFNIEHFFLGILAFMYLLTWILKHIWYAGVLLFANYAALLGEVRDLSLI